MSTSTTSNQPPANSIEFNREDWSSAYCNVEKELSDISLNPIRGKVPKELNGTLYRNGPARLERSGQWVHHPFDGDGMITALAFTKGSVKFSNRFVQTEAWKAEEKAGKFLYRGVFGTQKKGGLIANIFDVRLKNIANTNVIKLGDELLALWEADNPYAVNPKTLETIGPTSLKGLLKRNEPFSAHPRLDPGHHGEPSLVTFSVKTGPNSKIKLLEFACKGKDAGKVLYQRSESFKGFAFLHDFIITPNWAIFIQNSIAFNPIPFLIGQKGAAQCLSSQSHKQGKFLLIPRNNGKFSARKAKIFSAPEGFVFHHLNAWENNNEVIVESIYYNDFPSIGPNEDFRLINFDSLPEGLLKRCRINLHENFITTKELSPQCCEFAMVNPNFLGYAARFAWMAVAERSQGNAPLQAIKKIDLLKGHELFWSASPRGFVSEPIMVPRPGSTIEDEGWILVLIWNGSRKATDLVILNAFNLEELAIVELPIAIPHGLHGNWVPDNH